MIVFMLSMQETLLTQVSCSSPDPVGDKLTQLIKDSQDMIKVCILAIFENTCLIIIMSI